MHMTRRIHRIILLFALLIGGAGMNYVEAQTSGSCGTNVTWSLNTSTGVLTISGSGAMNDFAGGGLSAIDEKKQKQIEFAAESFLKFASQFRELNPLLAVADVSGENFELRNWFTLD